MPHRKSASTGPGGFEMIEARNDLRSKVREIPVNSPADDPVARAEAAVGRLAQHFDDWMKDEVSKVLDGHDAWVSTGHDPGEPQRAFYRAVHDVKGQAATLGFPLAAKAAASLCALLDHMDPARPVPRQLIDSHVDAIGAIFRERAKSDDDRVGTALVEALESVTGQYLSENGLASAEDLPPRD